MFSKLLLTLTFVISLTAVQADENASTEIDMFHKESDFMKGFETGLFLRSKNGNVEEYGCVVPQEANNQVKMAFE